MTQYFAPFPTINYQGRLVKDITRRNNFMRSISNNPYLFLPYTVKEGERPEDIALFYYGSTDYVWLVYLANNILDPYHAWPMDEFTFNNYIIDKYQERSGLTGDDVVAWTQSDNDENIVYYVREVT